MSVPNSDNPCGYMPFSHYDWHDISCNFDGYGHHVPWNPTFFCLYAAATAVAAQLAIQLMGRTFLRFKRRNTLYFWSLLLVAIGILIYIMALLFRIFILPVKSPAFSVPYTFAQIFILTGFGLVLYSRLHLITNNPWFLRSLLIMVIVIAFLGHTMSFVQLAIISLNKTLLSRQIMHAISWLDVIFTLQDLLLSVSYIYLYWKHMKDTAEFSSDAARARDATTFKLLIGANSLVITLDVIQNVLLCLKFYLARYMWFPLICAIRLEVEFFVLNRLVKNTEEATHALEDARFNLGGVSVVSKGGPEADVEINLNELGGSSGDSSDGLDIQKAPERRKDSSRSEPDYNSKGGFITQAC
ncbi:hypothetical protein BU24DRAFT_497560 [Aaosphaeria arxii CBS 175.79]|uniref:DUF7703 domain-containing protein n=1 Tax=Aaosphaeria arxii CBS 175.79 TaxID=1450172 RepID=A0A6A5X7J0_9PLEO|nr:uncharacterized protein BU24DRAFT_497560 [Aaosphaeria arxii CBS 175.79]KAF2008985.1 hypothetical protein BU24DRAFT_497560 [Aaosphaeria arxii CBS 175.79]